jgi:hypothetical protein
MRGGWKTVAVVTPSRIVATRDCSLLSLAPVSGARVCRRRRGGPLSRPIDVWTPREEFAELCGVCCVAGGGNAF